MSSLVLPVYDSQREIGSSLGLKHVTGGEAERSGFVWPKKEKAWNDPIAAFQLPNGKV